VLYFSSNLPPVFVVAFFLVTQFLVAKFKFTVFSILRLNSDLQTVLLASAIFGSANNFSENKAHSEIEKRDLIQHCTNLVSV
jgi:hypothetical protein